MPLPVDRLEEALSASSPARIARVAVALSEGYRSGKPPRIRTADEALAYAAVRMPATFAASLAAFGQVRHALPGWRPRSLLDVGAGPGTASWAALEVWPSIERITLVEREGAMIDLGKALGLPHATWVQADLAASWQAEPHDLVVASYVLNEVAVSLWHLANVLVLIEPGTPAGFERIRLARSQLIAGGAAVAAPCPHGDACPMTGSNWCHFAARVQRTSLHRQAKGAQLGHEDEKFSFVAVTRGMDAAPMGRVLRHPQVRKGHVILEVCTPEGLRRLTVTKSEGDRFRTARALHWGSPFQPD